MAVDAAHSMSNTIKMLLDLMVGNEGGVESVEAEADWRSFGRMMIGGQDDMDIEGDENQSPDLMPWQLSIGAISQLRQEAEALRLPLNVHSQWRPDFIQHIKKIKLKQALLM